MHNSACRDIRIYQVYRAVSPFYDSFCDPREIWFDSARSLQTLTCLLSDVESLCVFVCVCLNYS